MKLSYYLRKYWYRYLFGLFCIVSAVSLDMLNPLITQSIIDDVITGHKTNLLHPLLAAIFLIGVGRCVLGYLRDYLFDCTSSKISLDLRKKLFTHIQTLSIGYFHKTNTGEVMSRLKDDIDRIWDAFNFVSMLIIEVVIHTVIILFCMFRLNSKLFVIPVLVMPIVALLAIITERKLSGIYEDISEENALLNTIAQENLSGVRTVKAFSKEKFEIQKFLSHNKQYYDLNMRQSKVFIKYQPIFKIISLLLPISILAYGGYLTMKGEITLGTLGAYIEYSMNITWPLEMIGWLSNSAASAYASNQKIQKIFHTDTNIKDSENAVVLPNVSGDIQFEHVSFSMEGQEILKDINFHIKAGHTLGIMGATGSGKSSVLSLLQRFYDPNHGTVKLDQTDIKTLSLSQLRTSISPVFQDVFLFSDTINENVRFGKKGELDDKTVHHALSLSCSDSFVQELELKDHTIIGERGVGLSGGQKQRISIARALAKQSPILVLDDSTSALDMETEHMIQETLNTLTQTTKIIIAHRISAVRHADEIIFLDHGKIAERGTHESLLQKKGLYYKTYMAQYGDYLTHKSVITE